MRVMIIGAGGMLGAKLARRLATDGRLGEHAIERLVLVDLLAPPMPDESDVAGTHASPGIESIGADLAVRGVAARLVAQRPDVIYHLAAVVSGEAERDLEKGYRINLDGTRELFEAIRLEGELASAPLRGDGGEDVVRGERYCPRVVFSSSIAVFGAPFPDRIGDDFHLTPLTSYGTQKAMGELLLADYSRRGLLDGVGLRLPTICIRPGKPNLAASGFFSNILREPIHGRAAVLPVPDTVRHWFASPRAAVHFLVHAATLDAAAIGPHRNLNLPGLSATVAEQIEALGRVVGAHAVALIRREPDEAIRAIVGNWAEDLDPRRATALGFVAERSFDDIIRVYLEDDTGRSTR